MATPECFSFMWRQHEERAQGTACQNCAVNGRCRSLTLHQGEEAFLAFLNQKIDNTPMPKRELKTQGALASYLVAGLKENPVEVQI